MSTVATSLFSMVNPQKIEVELTIKNLLVDWLVKYTTQWLGLWLACDEVIYKSADEMYAQKG